MNLFCHPQNWPDDTPLAARRAMPDDLRPYVVVTLHCGIRDTPENRRAWESGLQEAESEGVPLVLRMLHGTPRPHAKPYLPAELIDEWFSTYGCLVGVDVAELSCHAAMYDAPAPGDTRTPRQHVMDLFDLCVKHGGRLLWRDMGYANRQHVWLQAAELPELYDRFHAHPENLLLIDKQNGKPQDGPESSFLGHSMALGWWLGGDCEHWGVDAESWMWYEQGRTQPFRQEIPVVQQSHMKAALGAPENLLGIKTLLSALSGATLFGWEFPPYACIHEGRLTPCFTQALLPLLRRIIEEELIPTREQVLKQCSAAFLPERADDAPLLASRLPCRKPPPNWMYWTGRYGWIPTLPVHASREVQSRFPRVFTAAELRDMTDWREVRQALDPDRPNRVSGNAWWQESADGRWTVVNPEENVDVPASFVLPAAADGVVISGVLPVYTWLQVTPLPGGGRQLDMNNYCSNKDKIWNGKYLNGEEPGWSGADCKDPGSACNRYMRETYVPGAVDVVRRTTQLRFAGLPEEPPVRVEPGADTETAVRWDAAVNVLSVAITHGGPVRLTVGAAVADAGGGGAPAVRVGRAPATPTVRVDEQSEILPDFQGLGFHVFDVQFPADERHWQEVILKRWAEIRPTFARLTHRLAGPDQPAGDGAVMQNLRRFLRFTEARTATQVYLTTWYPTWHDEPEAREREARRIVDDLEQLRVRDGCASLRWYCVANELSMRNRPGNSLRPAEFADMHGRIHAELQRRGVPVGLLSMDATPMNRWNTVDWACETLSDISAVYGGHHYFNDEALLSPVLYPFFRDACRRPVRSARAEGDKRFILGEFGLAQQKRVPVLRGMRNDSCDYFDTPEAPLVAHDLAAASLAAINAGVYGLAYWTFSDLPEREDYCNFWGIHRWRDHACRTRDLYYGYAPLVRGLGGPSTVLGCEVDGNDLYAAAVRHNVRGGRSVVVLNASDRTRRVRLAWPGDGPGWRLYRYDPARVIHHPFGDLPAPAAVLGIGAAPEVTVPARGWALLTTDWHDRSAAAVTGLKRSVTDTGRHRLEWEPGDDSVCYYRIYRRGPAGEQQAGTTIATAFEDDGGFADDEAGYRVVAVNDALNTGDDAVV